MANDEAFEVEQAVPGRPGHEAAGQEQHDGEDGEHRRPAAPRPGKDEQADDDVAGAEHDEPELVPVATI